MTRSKLPLLVGMTTSLLAIRCGGDGGSPFTDAGGRAGSGASGSAGSSSGVAGSAAGAGSGGTAGSSTACTPGASEACTGENGCEGSKLCLTDGSGFSACECANGHAGEGGISATGGAGSGAGGAADAGASGEGAGGVTPEGGNAGHVTSGNAGDAGAASVAGAGGGMGGAAGITGGGEGGQGDAGPITILVTDLMDTYVDRCNRNASHGSADRVLVDTDPCEYQAFFGPAAPLEIPAGAVVESATLRLVCDNEGGAVEVYAVEEAWEEASLDWNSRPELGAFQGSFTPLVGAIEIDLTDLVQAWVDAGTAFGVALVQPADSDGSDYLSAEVAEEEQRPSLSILYTR